MEINQFILALSKTLPESCLQSAVVYLVLQLLFLGYKRSTPSLKFNLYYAANLFLFIGFLYTFFYHYQQVPVTSFNNNLFSNKIGNHIQTVTIKPNLWIQLSFWTSRYAYLITAFYLLGLLFCVLKLTIGIINISWFKNNKYLKLDDYLTNISIQLSTKFRLIKTVPVYMSDKIFVPLTIGFIKPMIVFPFALINHLSAEQTEAILLHELAHIKRADYLLNVLLGVVRSFLFFNPVVWMMEREISKYREQSCDDLVLNLTSNKLAYAQALLLIEENRSTQLTFALPFNGKKHTLLDRIKRITNMKTTEPLPQNKLIVLLLALTTIGISVAWNLPVKKVIKQFTDRHLTHVTIVETKPDSSKVKLAANMMFVHKATHGSSKIEMIADTIFIEHQPRNKTGDKFTFQGKEIVYSPSVDTVIKSKNKFKIVLEDSTGNKKEYNSIDELPADAQKEFLKENRKLNQLQGFKYFQNADGEFQVIPGFNDTISYSSPEWKKQATAMRKQGEAMRKQFNSPEFKKQMEDIKIQGEEIRKQFNSPEFKKQMEDIKVQGEEIRKQFNSPEWKKQMETLRLQSAQISKQGVKMRKYYLSPEWKKQQKKMQKEIEKSQKEWRNSKDFQPQPIIPEKPNQPE